jgi:hypothetical protein
LIIYYYHDKSFYYLEEDKPMPIFDQFLMSLINELIDYGRANNKFSIVRKLLGVFVFSIALTLMSTILLPFSVFLGKDSLSSCFKSIYVYGRLLGASLVGIPVTIINPTDVVISVVTLLADVIKLFSGKDVNFGPSDDKDAMLKVILNTEPGATVVFNVPNQPTVSIEDQINDELANNTLFRRRFETHSQLYNSYWPMYSKVMGELKNLLKSDPNEFNNLMRVKVDMTNEFNSLSVEITNLQADTDFEIMDSKIRNFIGKYKS